MKKVLASALCLLMLALLATACSDTDKPPAKEPKPTEPVADQPCDIDDAVFRYGSGTGTGFSRYYIMYNGDIYGYSERFLDYEGQESDVKESIETLKYNNMKIGTMEADYLDKLVDLAIATKDAPREDKHVGEDMGGESAFYIDPATCREEMFYQTGDNIFVTDDEQLQEFWNLWEARDEHITIENATPCFTTEGFCSFNCGYIDIDGPEYMVFESLEAFEDTLKSWNVSMDMPDFLKDMKDDDRIFVWYYPVSSGGYSVLTSRFYCQGDNVYGFLASTENYKPDEGDVVPTVMDGFISIAKWRTSDDVYKLRGGDDWTVIR